ncbi:hypothetical protein V7087_26295 [Neobacillus niacini]|uniref:hypothetical protein n=1 Tax=Neobacillus niacini TaxID=86668 RepID=UPI002FFD7BEF
MIIIRQEQPTDYRNSENDVKSAFSNVEISDKKDQHHSGEFDHLLTYQKNISWH